MTALLDPPQTTGEAVRPHRQPAGVWRHRLIRVASVLVAIGLWELLTANGIRLWLRFDTLPTVTEIAAALAARVGTSEYWLDLGQSLIRILTGFGLAALIGVVTGIMLGRSRLFADVFGPLTELVRPIPAIAVVPVAILLFPSDEAGIVSITFLAAYFPIMVSTRHAVRALPTIWEDSVRTLGGGRVDVLRQVVLPGILPGLFGGLSVGMGVAWICVISAEMISGRLGVGYRTWQAYTVLDYPGVFVGIITIGVLGFGTAAAIELIGRRATRWLPRGEENDPMSAGRRVPPCGSSSRTSRCPTPALPVVRGLDLTVQPGEILVLTGPSGLREVHRAARPGRAAGPRRRPGARPTGTRSPPPRGTAAWSSRTARCCRGAACAPISNWHCSFAVSRGPGGGPAPNAGSTRSTSPDTPTICPRACPAACASGCSWPAGWPAHPGR